MKTSKFTEAQIALVPNSDSSETIFGGFLFPQQPRIGTEQQDIRSTIVR
jgi:hypothetical protein